MNLFKKQKQRILVWEVLLDDKVPSNYAKTPGLLIMDLEGSKCIRKDGSMPQRYSTIPDYRLPWLRRLGTFVVEINKWKRQEYIVLGIIDPLPRKR